MYSEASTECILNQDVYDRLEKVDWDTLGRRLAAHAAYMLRNSYWSGKVNDNVVDGVSPEDIARNAITRLFAGELNWDPSKGKLISYLKAIVGNEVKDLCTASKRFNACEIDGEEALKISPFAEAFIEKRASPEQRRKVAEEEAQATRRINTLMDRVCAEEEEELIEVLEALMDGCGHQPRHIADHLGVERKDIYNRLKRLRRRATEITEEQDDE